MTDVALPDLIEAGVPVGGRVLVVSQLLLTPTPTPASTSAATEVARAIDACTGPGAVIFNGGCVELLSGGCGDPRPALTAHPRLVTSVRDFARGPGRQVIYLPGSHDGRAAWDPCVAATLGELLGAELALAAELRIDTGAGTRVVRVEPGHRLDPLACFGDPRNPADSPLGLHLVREILPALHGARPDGGWLADLESLDDPAAFPRFLASRLVYRRLGRHAWWLLAPLLIAVVLRLPLAVSRRAQGHVGSVAHLLAVVGVATVVDLILVGLVAGVAIRRTWTALAGVALGRGAGREDLNAQPRALARDLVTAGAAGLDHRPHPPSRAGPVGPRLLRQHRLRLRGGRRDPVPPGPDRGAGALPGPPPDAWVELEAGNQLHVRLLHGRRNLPGATVLERLLARPRPQTRNTGTDDEPHPAVVATFPGHSSWPAPVDASPRLRRIRRRAAVLVTLAGVLSLVSAFVQPAERRSHALLQLIPLGVPEAADALVALASVGPAAPRAGGAAGPAPRLADLRGPPRGHRRPPPGEGRRRRADAPRRRGGPVPVREPRRLPGRGRRPVGRAGGADPAGGHGRRRRRRHRRHRDRHHALRQPPPPPAPAAPGLPRRHGTAGRHPPRGPPRPGSTTS